MAGVCIYFQTFAPGPRLCRWHSMNTPSPAEQSQYTTTLDLVESELARVETRISEVLGCREERITEIASYLIKAGGKRIRPAVSLLAFRACQGDDPSDVIDLSVALELIHSATLLHDDIIDSSDTRRGQDAAPVRFGIADTLVTGDFLFSRAFEICGRFDEKVVVWAADACVQLTEGEIMQGRYRRNLDVSEDDYLEIIGRKTASLFAAGARIAAYLAGSSPQRMSLMQQCGYEIGLAFQMIDDVLDIEGDLKKTGKPTDTDLLDGNPSLPVVWGLHLPVVKKAFIHPDCPAELAAEASRAIREDGIPARVRSRAVVHAQRCVSHLGQLPASPFREAMESLVCGLVDRDL